MDVIDMMFGLFSDEIDNISLDPDLIGDDEMWDMCDNIQAESEGMDES